MTDAPIRQECDETHEKCPRNAFRAARRNARVTVIIAGHGNRAVDEFSCRGHYEIRQAIHEGVEGGQGPHSG